MNDIGSGPVLQLLTCFAEIFQDLLVNKIHLAGWTHSVYEAGDVIDDGAKIGLALQQLLLGTLAIIDVCKKEIPRGYRVFRISHREAAHLEPSVNSIGTAAAVFNLVHPALFDRLDASLDDTGNIIRMNGISQGPMLQLFICLTEILEGLAVEKLHFAHCAHRRHQTRDVIDDLPPGQLLRTQVLLPSLAILDVCTGSVPFKDVSRLIPQRISANEEPSI